MRKLLHAIRIILLLCAMAASCGAAALATWSAYQVRTNIRTTGVVTDFWVDAFGKTHPIYQYQDEAGKSYTVRESLGTTDPGVVMDERIPVLYSPGDPTKSRIATWGRIWGFPVVYAVVGLATLLLGIGARILERRMKPAMPEAA